MNKIVTIDEAINILQQLKESGEEVVLMSGLNIENGTNFPAIPIDINHGIFVMKNSKYPISYAENCVMRSLKTQTDVRSINTLMFRS